MQNSWKIYDWKTFIEPYLFSSKSLEFTGINEISFSEAEELPTWIQEDKNLIS